MIASWWARRCVSVLFSRGGSGERGGGCFFFFFSPPRGLSLQWKELRLSLSVVVAFVCVCPFEREVCPSEVCCLKEACFDGIKGERDCVLFLFRLLWCDDVERWER